MILEVVCSDYGVVPIIKILKTIFQMIQILGPVLAMVSLAILFLKIIGHSNEKEYLLYKKQIKNCIIALVVTFFLPIFVNLVMNMTFMVDNFTVSECWSAADKINLSYGGEYQESPNSKKNNSGSYIINPSDYTGEGTDDNPNATNDPNSNNGNSDSDNGDNSTDSNDKSGTAGTNKSGKVTYLTKNGKNWNLNSKIGYSLNQGACSDGKYLYVAFKRDDSHARIGKFDIESRKLIKKSKVMNLGHANDMTYDYGRRKIIVTRRETNDLHLSIVDPDTFSQKVVKVTIPGSVSGISSPGAIKAFNGVIYDSDRGQLLVRARYGNSQLVWLNDNFRAVKGVVMRKGFATSTQGMEMINNKVIYAQSILQYRSSVTSYKRSGKKIKGTLLGVHGELEGVVQYKGDLYGLTYDKRGKNKTLIYKIDKSCY